MTRAADDACMDARHCVCDVCDVCIYTVWMYVYGCYVCISRGAPPRYGYTGYHPTTPHTVTTISSHITPTSFYHTYIATRTPVIIDTHICDAAWLGDAWSNAYLKRKAGDEIVQVEVRQEKTATSTLTSTSTKSSTSTSTSSAPSNVFGHGNKINMSYAAFLDALATGDERYYMTTQAIRNDSQHNPKMLAGTCIRHAVYDM